MALPRLSYFEFWDCARGIFVSLFPTEKTTLDSKSNFPSEGDQVFPTAYNQPDSVFIELFFAMKERDFGFFDNFWFVPKTFPVYTLENIKTWMHSLVYVPESDTMFYKRYAIKSKLDPTFNLVVFVKSQSLPQEAIDVIPIFDDGMSKYVAIGQKKISQPVSISTQERVHPITLLSTGKYGFVIFGEHLEHTEKQVIYDVASRFTGSPIEMTQREISSSLRTLFEEGGFSISDCSGKFYYIHEDSRPARDDRYWTYETDDNVFGYKRISTSHTIVLHIKGQAPETLNDPDDIQECSRGIVVKDSDAIDLLVDSGAFFSHVFQLCIALYSPLFFNGSRYIGKTFREALREHGGALRIAMSDNRCIYITPTDYSSTRLNVCVSQSNGRIVRVLGFY